MVVGSGVVSCVFGDHHFPPFEFDFSFYAIVVVAVLLVVGDGRGCRVVVVSRMLFDFGLLVGLVLVPLVSGLVGVVMVGVFVLCMGGCSLGFVVSFVCPILVGLLVWVLVVSCLHIPPGSVFFLFFPLFVRRHFHKFV